MRPLGPGMMQQIQQPCQKCGQTGYSVPPNDQCPSCSGRVSLPLLDHLSSASKQLRQMSPPTACPLFLSLQTRHAHPAQGG